MAYMIMGATEYETLGPSDRPKSPSSVSCWLAMTIPMLGEGVPGDSNVVPFWVVYYSPY